MDDLARVTTGRLVLAAPSDDDLAELHALHADPAVWEHFPSLRHTDLARTEELLRRVQDEWRRDGLSSWVVRSAQDGALDGARCPLLGLGGCSVRHGVAWNLGYRLAPGAWGRGYAQEVIAAARAAAERVRPDLPVVAYLLEHNERSRRAAERAGLALVWRGPDAGNPDPTAVRLVLADRPLDAATLEVLTRT